MSKNAEILWGCAWRWVVLIAASTACWWWGWHCGGAG
jgi:hypothetical protein